MKQSNVNVLALTLLAGTGGTALAQPYPITGIGNLVGGPSNAWGISSGIGQPVVGETDTNNSLTHRACTFTTGMAATNNGSGPGGFFTPKCAYRISATNLIYCGSGQSASLSTRAFRNYGGVTTELGTINPFLQNSEARGINNSGTIVGTCYANNSYPGAGGNNSFAFKWVPNNPSDPTNTTGVLSFAVMHAAYDVNDNGLAVGSIGSLPYQVNLATSALTSMGSLGGTLGSGVAVSNNNAGAAVGWSPAPNNFRHAMRWTAAGGIQDINPVVLGATAESFAFDINSAGVVVGKFHGTGTGSNGHAFIYNPASGMWRDLNTWLPSGSGWVLESAEGISDGNCVVGRGKRNGQTEGFKMCVVPPMVPPPPCGGLPLDPIAMAHHASCPGGTVVFDFDPTPVGGGGGTPVTVEWAFKKRLPSSTGDEVEYVPVVDGVNIDPDTGEPAFTATIGGTVSATALTMTTIASPAPGGQGHDGGGWTMVALVRGPCDTRYTHAATNFVAAADLGSQGGVAGGDGVHDNNDFVVFIDKFFTADAGADVGVQGGQLGSDGAFDNNDFVVFIDLFFQSCP
ncbi:MAG: GC-type dockerin domain-anchored protein [Phycisphaerales bacterium]|nr:GC-type dockerin domain-anchored protein [Phycisphaerales bacterium]